MLGALSVNSGARVARHQLVSSCLLHLLGWERFTHNAADQCVTPVRDQCLSYRSPGAKACRSMFLHGLTSLTLSCSVLHCQGAAGQGRAVRCA